MKFKSERTIFDSENLGMLCCMECGHALRRGEELIIIGSGKQRARGLALRISHRECHEAKSIQNAIDTALKSGAYTNPID